MQEYECYAIVLKSSYVFLRYDRDNSGSICFAEFERAVRRDVQLTPAQFSDLDLKHAFVDGKRVEPLPE
eukprot:COSAG05_NODE_9635_length_610_cov_21.489422_1_plen_69_part_00